MHSHVVSLMHFINALTNVRDMAVSANEASGRRFSAIPSDQYASDGGNGTAGTFITTRSDSSLSFVLSYHFYQTDVNRLVRV